MLPRRKTLSALLTLALLGAAPLGAEAMRLTGTWLGKLKCKGDQGETYRYSSEQPLFITQFDEKFTSRLNISFGTTERAEFTGSFEERAAHPESRAVVAFRSCFPGRDDGLGRATKVYGGSVRLSVDSVSGSLNIKGIEVHGAGAPGATFIQCKGIYRRVATTNPGVDDCN